MATPEQMQQVINLLQQQMTTMSLLQAENATLRDSATNTNDNDGSPANNATTEGRSKYKSKKPDRPIINASIDDREWALFNDTWARYKQMCNLADTDVASTRLELRASCSTEVNKLLFEYVGATVLNSCTEAELLEHIKAVAVKTTHKEVHRMAFSTISQDQGESVTQFVSRLKAKAFLCQLGIIEKSHKEK